MTPQEKAEKNYLEIADLPDTKDMRDLAPVLAYEWTPVENSIKEEDK